MPIIRILADGTEWLGFPNNGWFCKEPTPIWVTDEQMEERAKNVEKRKKEWEKTGWCD